MNRVDRAAIKEDPPKMSTQRWAVTLRDVFCCMDCVRMRKSRWGKHPHNKPKREKKT